MLISKKLYTRGAKIGFYAIGNSISSLTWLVKHKWTAPYLAFDLSEGKSLHNSSIDSLFGVIKYMASVYLYYFLFFKSCSIWYIFEIETSSYIEQQDEKTLRAALSVTIIRYSFENIQYLRTLSTISVRIRLFAYARKHDWSSEASFLEIVYFLILLF